MTQEQRVIKYLRDFGSITGLQGYQDLGNSQVRTTICKMRANGWNIVGKTEYGKNRYGEPTHWTRYSFGETERI